VQFKLIPPPVQFVKILPRLILLHIYAFFKIFIYFTVTFTSDNIDTSEIIKRLERALFCCWKCFISAFQI